MSAECSKCGADIVYPDGTWPVGRCEVCDLRALFGNSRPDLPDLDELERDDFDLVKIRAALPFLIAEARKVEALTKELREFRDEAVLSLIRPGRLAEWKARFAALEGASDE